MRKTGIFLSLIATLMLVSLAFASWKGTGLRLGITTQGSNTSFTQSVSYNTAAVTSGTYNSTNNPIDVSGVNVLKADTSGGDVNIAGLANGVEGQVLQVVVVDNSNGLVMKHNNSTGTQKLYVQAESDQTLSTYGGFTMVCNGTAWFEAGD